jgi:hypothetical protein
MVTLQTTHGYSAVETHYNGIKFRSRLEARWAVYFDCLGIKYDYEPEKFQIGDRRYIPDFFLHGVGYDYPDRTFKGAFFEVKGPLPTYEEVELGLELHRITRNRVFLFSGSGFSTGIECCYGLRRHLSKDYFDVMIEQCAFCGACEFAVLDSRTHDPNRIHGPSHPCLEAIAFAKRYDVMDWFRDCSLTPKIDIFPHEGRSPMLDLAMEAARSMRFEDPLHKAEMEGIALSIKRLRNAKVFCYPDRMGAITEIAIRLRANPNCPHYENEDSPAVEVDRA